MRSPYILLVEDDPDDTVLIQWAFTQAGCRHELVVVKDGEEALSMLFPETGGPVSPPDLVLLDLRLPRIEGPEILRRLRAHALTRVVPIVVLTSSREDRDVERCYALGANSYVYKPVEFSAYRDTLTHLWTYWLTMNVNPHKVWP